MSKKVHIGFGFHVNCYHSYRGDTPDALGFGSDIRIMRHIISTLDRYNQMGVPVKGTWDFENAFSLEEVLPVHAPDIIADVKRRQEENGDENILMGYNNGAMSAMTEDEFLASVSWGVTNEKGSGLKDVFGDCEYIIRPQEMMFTSSQVPLYKKAGLKCLCLYYSCVPFDAFRTLVPQLTDEYAFNPVNFVYQEEKLCVLPTYSHSDVMDAGSLRWLVSDLHRQQQEGSIQNDVFLFINIDADSFLWEPMPVPAFLKKVPNMNGLEGFIQETMDLDFVVYDTPGGYLKNHRPLVDITFHQDTADGNFTGYASWAEKPFNRQIWTRLERARSYARLAESDRSAPSFEERIRLLSTTHFGLAAPVMNIVREQKALSLSDAMVEKEICAQKKEKHFALANPEKTAFASAQLLLEPGFCRRITDLNCREEGLVSWNAVLVDAYEDGSIKSVFWMAAYEKAKDIYQPLFESSKASVDAPDTKTAASDAGRGITLSAGELTFTFHPQGKLESVCLGKEQIGGADFLQSHICYDGKDYPFVVKQAASLPMAGQGEGICIMGEIHLPKELAPGYFTYQFYTLPGTPGIHLISDVQYPYTLEDHEISTSSSSLGRYSDAKWEQVMPLEITPEFSHHLSVMKRNFMGHANEFPVSDFWKSVPENESIDSFNHQLSGGLLGLGDGRRQLFVANARQSLNSMACCPMRLRKRAEGHQVSMNMFGTYFGCQRHYPTRGNGSMNDMYVLTMPQARSLAPSYNGVREIAVMGFFGGYGTEGMLSSSVQLPVEEGLYRHMIYFADGLVPVDGEEGPVHPFLEDNVTFQDAKLKPAPKKLKGAAAAGVGSRSRLVKAGLGVISTILQAGKKVKKYEKER